MKTPGLIALVGVLLYSCKSEIKKIPYIDTDSIKNIRIMDSLSKKLNAVNFDSYYDKHYSVEFDSMLNKRCFSTNYRLRDIKRDSTYFLVVFSIGKRFIITVKAKENSIPLLNKMIHGDDPNIIFSLTNISRGNITSSNILFYAKGILLD